MFVLKFTINTSLANEALKSLFLNLKQSPKIRCVIEQRSGESESKFNDNSVIYIGDWFKEI